MSLRLWYQALMPYSRACFVVSDLHLGGDPAADVVGGRGFKMCQQGELLAEFILAIAAKDSSRDPAELIINGDFVDFLAERPVDDETSWTPFHRDPEHAKAVFLRVANEREPQVFDALQVLLSNGHRLCIMLGNHDLELSLPAVREALAQRVGAGPGKCVDFEIRYDNEAYVLGDVIIEHGNQEDALNRVDFGALRRVRSDQSRHLDAGRTQDFEAPAGSHVVAGLMNDLKAEFPFIDLLKPEGSAAVLLLVALKPSLITRIPEFLAYVVPATARSAAEGRSRSRTSKVARSRTGQSRPWELKRVVGDVLSESDGTQFLDALGVGKKTAKVARSPAGPVWSAVRIALLGLFDDEGHFAVDTEHNGGYRDAAIAHGKAGFRTVIFGHTHFRVSTMVGEVKYLNTGTWADVLRLPAEARKAISLQNPLLVDAEFEPLLTKLRNGELVGLQRHAPFVRIDVAADGSSKANLFEYTGGDPTDARQIEVGDAR